MAGEQDSPQNDQELDLDPDTVQDLESDEKDADDVRGGRAAVYTSPRHPACGG